MRRARTDHSLSGFDAHQSGVDLATLHALLGHYARLYWDLQAARIAVSNRRVATERAGLRPHYLLPIHTAQASLQTTEKMVKTELRAKARQHFMRDWVDAQRGLDYLGFANLMGVTGSLDRFATVAKLWKYLGLHVQEGEAPHRQKGVPWTHTACTFKHLAQCKPGCRTDHHRECVPNGVGTAYSPRGRVVCHQIGVSIMKAHRRKRPDVDGPYQMAYSRKKAEYEAGRPDWPQARRHNAAMRYAVKLLIKEMWLEWHRRRVPTGPAPR